LNYSNTPGNVFTSVFEGSRPLNVQIQALVSRVKMASGRRISHGIDVRKVIIISAVLAKHLNLPLDFHDIYINVSGGLNITDPGCELAIAGAILSSFLDSYIGNALMVGEVGLDGSIRPTVNVTKRIENAKKLQIERIIVPANVDYNSINSKSDLKVEHVKDVRDLFELVMSEKTDKI